MSTASYEANVSTKEIEAKPPTRIPKAKRDGGRTQGTRRTKTKGAKEAHGVSVFPMLPRAYRLSDHQEIREVFRVGKRANGSLFSFIFLRNTSPVSRFAVIVSKKVAPRAVDRNRVKRLVREAIHHQLPQLAPGYVGIILLSKKLSGKLTLHTVSPDIEALFRRVHMLS